MPGRQISLSRRQELVPPPPKNNKNLHHRPGDDSTGWFHGPWRYDLIGHGLIDGRTTPTKCWQKLRPRCPRLETAPRTDSNGREACMRTSFAAPNPPFQIDGQLRLHRPRIRNAPAKSISVCPPLLPALPSALVPRFPSGPAVLPAGTSKSILGMGERQGSPNLGHGSAPPNWTPTYTSAIREKNPSLSALHATIPPLLLMENLESGKTPDAPVFKISLFKNWGNTQQRNRRLRIALPATALRGALHSTSASQTRAATKTTNYWSKPRSPNIGPSSHVFLILGLGPRRSRKPPHRPHVHRRRKNSGDFLFDAIGRRRLRNQKPPPSTRMMGLTLMTAGHHCQRHCGPARTKPNRCPIEIHKLSLFSRSPHAIAHAPPLTGGTGAPRSRQKDRLRRGPSPSNNTPQTWFTKSDPRPTLRLHGALYRFTAAPSFNALFPPSPAQNHIYRPPHRSRASRPSSEKPANELIAKYRPVFFKSL